MCVPTNSCVHVCKCMWESHTWVPMEVRKDCQIPWNCTQAVRRRQTQVMGRELGSSPRTTELSFQPCFCFFSLFVPEARSQIAQAALELNLKSSQKWPWTSDPASSASEHQNYRPVLPRLLCVAWVLCARQGLCQLSHIHSLMKLFYHNCLGWIQLCIYL